MHSSDQPESAAEMFGLLLRHFRVLAGLSQEQLGKRIGYSKSQVAMVERGSRPPTDVFVQRADEVLGAQGALIVAAPKPPKQTERRNPLPGWFTPFADDEIEAKDAARLERQKLLSRRPLADISFVLEMIVLTRPIGGRRVMKAQLHHLAEVARLRHVRIQLMDPDREDHAALDGPFVLLETDKRQQLAHIEGQGGSFFVAEQPELGNLFGTYGVTRAQAYTPERTIEKMAEEL
ncbi:helix-turn-helix transcriptional regulator [Streptomyces anulatus]|uniref:helix-turn-helix domain-containing protein n=1 Tax=Streptomyces anulatus TaxID=1892 RepID=UPI002E0FE545|nr:helix-turn-helix transcriptional regulator [Streptomyces anulatus]